MANDELDSYVRAILLHFIKAIELIKHNLLSTKQHMYGLPSLVVKWMATFLLDITQLVLLLNNKYSHFFHPKGAVRNFVCTSIYPCKHELFKNDCSIV